MPTCQKISSIICNRTALSATISADNLDYIEWKENYRVEGATASVGSFINKVGQAVGAALPGYILAATGYVAATEIQTEEALHGILLAITLIPLVTAVLGALIYLAYPTITHASYDAFMAELAERKQELVN